jgi:hypothetical protein
MVLGNKNGVRNVTIRDKAVKKQTDTSTWPIDAPSPPPTSLSISAAPTQTKSSLTWEKRLTVPLLSQTAFIRERVRLGLGLYQWRRTGRLGSTRDGSPRGPRRFPSAGPSSPPLTVPPGPPPPGWTPSFRERKHLYSLSFLIFLIETSIR